MLPENLVMAVSKRTVLNEEKSQLNSRMMTNQEEEIAGEDDVFVHENQAKKDNF